MIPNCKKDIFITDDMVRYSTDEKLTEKVWIDGKPMYRKVLRFEISDSTRIVDLSTIDFKDGFVEWGRMYKTVSDIKYIDTLPMTTSYYSYTQIVCVNQKWSLQFISNDPSVNGFLCEICILYTKTTD